jgi:hypothetical protein
MNEFEQRLRRTFSKIYENRWMKIEIRQCRKYQKMRKKIQSKFNIKNSDVEINIRKTENYTIEKTIF